MDLCCSGVEIDHENCQVLGNPISGAKHGEANGLCTSPDKIHPETLVDPRWLMMPKQGNPGIPLHGDHWSKLRISDDEACFRSPMNKRDSGCNARVASSVSTMAICWSPQAMCAPSLKTTRVDLESICDGYRCVVSSLFGLRRHLSLVCFSCF